MLQQDTLLFVLITIKTNFLFLLSGKCPNADQRLKKILVK